MNNADIFSIYESRKQFWDDFEKKYAMKQRYGSRDYSILEFHKEWPGETSKQNHNTRNSCCKQKTEEDEAMYDSSAVQSNLEGLNNKENSKCGAKVDSNVQNSEEEREESERECSSPKAHKSSDVRVKDDIQISKTGVKCHRQINKIAAKHELLTQVHSSTANDAPIVTPCKNENITVDIQSKSERIKSELQDKNQHEMETSIREGDLKLPFGITRLRFSSAIKTNKQASDTDCSKIKHSRENSNGIADHVMENVTTIGSTVTAQVQQRYTSSQFILGKQGSAFTRNMNCKDGCIHSVCKNILLDEVHRNPFTELIKTKDKSHTARKSCNSSEISDNEENHVIKEERPNKSAIHRSKNTDSSALTCISTTPNFSKNTVSDKIEILEKQTKRKCNKTPQTNRIANVSTATLNDVVQTVKSNTKADACASAAKSASSDIMHIHQKSSRLSSAVENDNDLHVIHKNYVTTGKGPNKSVMHRPKNTGASNLTSTSTIPNSSENAVSDMIQILEKQTKGENNKTPQPNEIAIASTISTATLNDAVHTGKSNINDDAWASVAKSASSNIMHIYQTSSRESSLLENDNDLHVIHKSKCSSPNLLQRNEKEANITNIRHKAIMKHEALKVLLHGNTVTSSKGFCSKNNHKTSEKENNCFNDKLIQKSLVDGTVKVHLQDKMAQSTETTNENFLPVTATKKGCGNKCLAKQKIEGEYTSYSSVDNTANAIEDVLELSIRNKNNFRKRFTTTVKQVLICKPEQQDLTCSLSKVRNFTATEGQDGFTYRNEKLDEINNGEIWTSLNKLVIAEDAISKSKQRQKQLQRQTENTKKRGTNHESNSREVDSIAVQLTILGSSSAYDSDHSVEAKQKGERCISERLSIPSKTPQPCPFNYDENCLQSELAHSIKTVSKKQNMVAKILEFDREVKSAASDHIMEQLLENVSEKNTKCLGNRSPEKQFKENHRSNCGQQNDDWIIQVPVTDSLLKRNDSALEYKSKKLDICKSKADFCESNEINSCKHNSNNLADAESTVSQSKYHHMEIQNQENHKRIKSDAETGLAVSNSSICSESNCFDIQSLQTKPSTLERTNVHNKSLEKPPPNPVFQVPCPLKSRKKSTRNVNEAHNVAPITLENNGKNFTNGGFINGSIGEQLHHELCYEDILRNKPAGKEIRKKLSSKTPKQNKGNINEESMKPFASKINNLSVTEQHKFITKELEHADILKGMSRFKTNGNSSSGSLCAQDTLSGNEHEQTQAQVKIKRKRVYNIAHARDAKDGARVDLVMAPGSVCSNSDFNEIWQLRNKYSASEKTYTQIQASNKPVSQLWPCTSVASVECQSNLSSSDCIASEMLANFSSESWTTFTSRVVNDLQTPLSQKKQKMKHRLRYTK